MARDLTRFSDVTLAGALQQANQAETAAEERLARTRAARQLLAAELERRAGLPGEQG